MVVVVVVVSGGGGDGDDDGGGGGGRDDDDDDDNDAGDDAGDGVDDGFGAGGAGGRGTGALVSFPAPLLSSPQKFEVVPLLATGSADSRVYVYQPSKRDGETLTQRLEVCSRLCSCLLFLLVSRSLTFIAQGHTDRVMAACFHPMEPILASASSDSTVRLWWRRN